MATNRIVGRAVLGALVLGALLALVANAPSGNAWARAAQSDDVPHLQACPQHPVPDLKALCPAQKPCPEQAACPEQKCPEQTPCPEQKCPEAEPCPECGSGDYTIALRMLYNISRKSLDDFREANNHTRIDGHSGQVPQQTVDIQELMGRFGADEQPVVCETGFNAGHSAVAFLASHPRTIYHAFDLADRPFTDATWQHVRAMFGDDRIFKSWGDSRKTIPKYFEEHKDLRCNVVSVDGGHTGDAPRKDLENFFKVASKGCYVHMDDLHCTPYWCRDTTNAWQALVDDGRLKEIKCQKANDDSRGWCVGQFIN